jgi:dTMP kinase
MGILSWKRYVMQALSSPPFIVIEGIDGSGKSTQADRLADSLGAYLTCEPTHGPVGQLIREGLKTGAKWATRDVMSRLFAADRHYHQAELDAFLSTRPVVSDRYLPSSMAYQSVKEWEIRSIFWINNEGRKVRVPDLTVFIDVPPALAFERIQNRGRTLEKFENEGFITDVRERYLYTLDWLGWEYRVVDGVGSESEVAARVLDEVRRICPVEG